MSSITWYHDGDLTKNAFIITLFCKASGQKFIGLEGSYLILYLLVSNAGVVGDLEIAWGIKVVSTSAEK